MDVHTSPVKRLREHLLRLSRHSIAPQYGGTVAQVGSVDEAAVLTRFRPFAELFVIISAADGNVAHVEQAVTLGAFRALTGGRVRGQTLERLENDLRRAVAREGVDGRLEVVCSHLSADRSDAELAFTLASVIALADDTLAPRESDLLRTLAIWLRIPQARAQELLAQSMQ